MNELTDDELEVVAGGTLTSRDSAAAQQQATAWPSKIEIGSLKAGATELESSPLLKR